MSHHMNHRQADALRRRIQREPGFVAAVRPVRFNGANGSPRFGYYTVEVLEIERNLPFFVHSATEWNRQLTLRRPGLQGTLL
jgi:hypothetical protein